MMPPCSCNNCARCFGDALDRQRAARGWPPGFAVLRDFIIEDMTTSAVAAAWMIVDAVQGAERERIAAELDDNAEEWEDLYESNPGDNIAGELGNVQRELASWIREGGK